MGIVEGGTKLFVLCEHLLVNDFESSSKASASVKVNGEAVGSKAIDEFLSKLFRARPKARYHRRVDVRLKYCFGFHWSSFPAGGVKMRTASAIVRIRRSRKSRLARINESATRPGIGPNAVVISVPSIWQRTITSPAASGSETDHVKEIEDIIQTYLPVHDEGTSSARSDQTRVLQRASARHPESSMGQARSPGPATVHSAR